MKPSLFAMIQKFLGQGPQDIELPHESKRIDSHLPQKPDWAQIGRNMRGGVDTLKKSGLLK